MFRVSDAACHGCYDSLLKMRVKALQSETAITREGSTASRQRHLTVSRRLSVAKNRIMQLQHLIAIPLLLASLAAEAEALVIRRAFSIKEDLALLDDATLSPFQRQFGLDTFAPEPTILESPQDIFPQLPPRLPPHSFTHDSTERSLSLETHTPSPTGAAAVTEPSLTVSPESSTANNIRPLLIAGIIGGLLLLILLVIATVVVSRRMYPSKGAGKKSRDASDRPFLEPSLASTSMTRPLISNRGGGLTAYATGSILLYGNSADMTKAPPSSVGSGERTLDSDNLEYVPILLRKATGRVREVKGGPRYLDPTRNTLIPILSLVNPEPSVEIAFEQCVVAQLGDPTTIPLGDSRQGHMGLELTCLPLRTYSAYERPDAIGLGSSAASRISTLSDAASISASSRISLDGSALTDETKRRGSLKAGQISLDGFDMIDGVTFRAAYQHVPMLPDEVELRYGDIIKVSLFFKDGWAHGTNETLGLFGAFPMFAVEERSPDDVAT